jgi:hypothetical protein
MKRSVSRLVWVFVALLASALPTVARALVFPMARYQAFDANGDPLPARSCAPMPSAPRICRPCAVWSGPIGRRLAGSVT